MLTLKDRTEERLQASMTIGIPKVCADGNRLVFRKTDTQRFRQGCFLWLAGCMAGRQKSWKLLKFNSGPSQQHLAIFIALLVLHL